MVKKRQAFLITLDAVRPDHLGCYGYKRETSPNIDKLAETATVYKSAFASSTHTLPSVPSFLSGRHPVNTYIRFGFPPPHLNLLDPDLYAILNSLREKGFRTAGFTSNIITSTHFIKNIDASFDYFDDELTAEESNRPGMLFNRSNETVSRVCEWVLRHKSENFFCWVHLMDAHGPYVPEIKSIFEEDKIYKADKRAVDRVVSDDYRGETIESLANSIAIPRYQVQKAKKDSKGNIEEFERRVAFYISQYDMGIRVMDESLGALFKHLEGLGILDKADIFVHSDHGEFLGEEGLYFTHGNLATPAGTAIPLIFKSGRERESMMVGQAVSNLDIMPTVARLVGLDIPPDLDGVPLGEREAGQRIFCASPKNVALIEDGTFNTVHLGDLEVMGGSKDNPCLLASSRQDAVAQIDDVWGSLDKWSYVRREGRFVEKEGEMTEEKEDLIKQFVRQYRSKFIVPRSYIPLVQEVSVLSNQVNLLEEDLKGLTRRVEDLRSLTGKVAKLEGELNHVQKELENIYRSRAWRLVTILRRIKHLSIPLRKP